MIAGVGKVVVDVEDQDRAKAFYTDMLGFSLVQDSPYGEGERWLEVRSPDGVVVVLGKRHPQKPGPQEQGISEMLPTSNIMWVCDDLQKTHQELTDRGVTFTQEPVKMDFGWWSMFLDSEGNRFALIPRGQ
jgi:lactoylglutathione lyase